MHACEKEMGATEGSSQPASQPASIITHPEPAKLRQTNTSALDQMQGCSTASTFVEDPEPHENSGGEPWPFRMAAMQSQNKMYMAVPNLTDVSFAGIQYLGIHIHRLRLEILEEGEGTPRYDELMMRMINLKLKFDKIRMGIYEGSKLPDPFVSDVRKICDAAVDTCPDDVPVKDSNWLVSNDTADWSRLSVMTPTKHLVSRLPESRIGAMVPARLRHSTAGRGTEAYSPRIFQFFSVSAEVLFIVMIWVFGSVPVLIKSLENPNKKVDALFYSLFFISWSILTSMLTAKFETRLYLNVGMAALYVQNIRAD